MSYVDGFVIPLKKNKIKDYIKIAKLGAKVWMDHGALQYFECVGEDLKIDPKWSMPFPKMVKPKPGETVVFSFIIYKSRKHRDQVNKKVMKDPRLKGDPKKMPFDPRRMAYGGFEAVVEA